MNTSPNSTVLTSASIDNLKEFVEKLTPYFHLENHDIVTVSTKYVSKSIQLKKYKI